MKRSCLFLSLVSLLSMMPLYAQEHIRDNGEIISQEERKAQALAAAEHVREQQNITMIFSNIETPETKTHIVVDGETIGKIARTYQTTIELIKLSNQLTTHIIRIGQKLRIWTTPFTISIDKSDNTLTVFSNKKIIKTYSVATGADNITPIGEFLIESRLTNPTWFKKGLVIPPQSPENALGTRWLGFNKPQYGIHGTLRPELIGQQVSHGCVRMRNSDVEELYNYIPTGTLVSIQD